ncbi:hypothetical protein [Streptomyces sp. NPDC090021]|uniref:hypothetical protein n=1 Tax=Streptomyces sp. NPDC090021 TaxID=3365919 RepID=UPI0038309555
MRARNLIRALAIPAACGITLAVSTSAQAHYVYYAEMVWANADSSLCLWNYSETSHGSTGGGYFKGQSRSQADIDANPLDCILGWERNTGKLAEGMIIYKWYDGDWLICNRTDQWYYNSAPAATFELRWTAPSGGMCGAGYYGLINLAGMQEGNQWVGWDVTNWSGYHWLPDNSLAASGSDAPAEPEWVKGKSLNKSPAKLPKADSSGKPVKDRNGKLVMVDATLSKPTRINGTTGGIRTTSVDEKGNVTETVTVGLGAS